MEFGEVETPPKEGLTVNVDFKREKMFSIAKQIQFVCFYIYPLLISLLASRAFFQIIIFKVLSFSFLSCILDKEQNQVIPFPVISSHVILF